MSSNTSNGFLAIANSTFHSIPSDEEITQFVIQVVHSEGYALGDLGINFMSDDELLEINCSALNHDYYTDIITFDDAVGNMVHGVLNISLDRVFENAQDAGVAFAKELHRVIAHGLLHIMGYDDHSESDRLVMRQKEDEKLDLFHVEP